MQAVLTQYEARFPSLASCKPMLGYMVGWAAGDAYVQFLSSWQSDEGPACWWGEP